MGGSSPGSGPPKGVVSRYQHTGFAGIRMFGAVLKPDDVLYSCLPLFHANALLLTTVRALAMGLPMALSGRFSASRFLGSKIPRGVVRPHRNQ